GFRGVNCERVGGRRARCARFAFDEQWDAERASAGTNGAVRSQAGATRRHTLSAAAAARFSTRHRSENGLADFALTKSRTRTTLIKWTNWGMVIWQNAACVTRASTSMSG